MANEAHLNILKQGLDIWRKWRNENDDIVYHSGRIDLSEADLRGINLRGADLSGVDLRGANLREVDLGESNFSEVLFNVDLHSGQLTISGPAADLREADLQGATLRGADLSGVDLRGANLQWTNLRGTIINLSTKIDDKWRLIWEIVNGRAARQDLTHVNLSHADLSEANLIATNLENTNLASTNLIRANLTRANLTRARLEGAILEQATLVETNLEEADLSNCHIYGIAAWNLNLKGAAKRDLIITPQGEPTITVDNLEVAQFVYLLLNNENIRDIINTITTKAVLILGRFTPERIKILNALRNALRKHNYVPILFDFDKPATRDLTETVRTLAHMARFIIADLTLPRSIPQELQAIVPDLAVPIQPILMKGVDNEYAMFQDLRRKYHWVLQTYEYQGLDELLSVLEEKIIAPAETKAKQLEQKNLM